MANIYSLKGTSVGKIDAPKIFGTAYRPDLIQRAVVALQANKRQTYGAAPRAGLDTSAEYFGSRRRTYRISINRAMSRLPRLKPGGGGLGNVRRVPQAVHGRRAHPPKNKLWEKKINRKEELNALYSAIAATSNIELVKARGHKVDKLAEVPLIIEDSLEKIDKTKDVITILNALGLQEELDRAKEKKIRSGIGKLRGRKYVRKKSALIVVNEDKGLKKASKNIPGIDVATLNELDVELLAPGTHAGRLTLWTKSAIENIDKLGKPEKTNDGA